MNIGHIPQSAFCVFFFFLSQIVLQKQEDPNLYGSLQSTVVKKIIPRLHSRKGIVTDGETT